MIRLTHPVKLTNLKKEDALKVQAYLKELDYDSGSLDGIIGQKTLNAFNKFKEDYDLTNPDEIGPTTIQVLQMAIAKEFDKTENEAKHPKQPILSKPQTVSSVNWFDFDCPISEYFTVGEVSQWSKERIVVSSIHRRCVLNLAKELDIVRKDWGKPIGVTSWYRPYAVNKRVGGVPNSTHITGSAVDIYPINGDIWAFQKWIDSRWQKALGWGAKKGFVHIDMRSQPKRIRWNY